MSFAEILNSIWVWIATEGVKVVLGLIVLFILFKVCNIVFSRIQKRLLAKGVDETITKSGVMIARRIIKVLLVLSYITLLGVETSSISAAIASVGLAIGLALQGSLSNLAGGVVILLTRPFKIGDYVECGNESGTIEKIEFFYTYILTDNNQVLMIPNSQVANDKIINYSTKETRRLEIEFRVGYQDNTDLAKQLILQCVNNTNMVLNEPAPFVNIRRYDANEVTLVMRVWVKTKEYWTVYWNLMEAVKLAFDEHDINIPYNQVDVHIKTEEDAKKIEQLKAESKQKKEKQKWLLKPEKEIPLLENKSAEDITKEEQPVDEIVNKQEDVEEIKTEPKKERKFKWFTKQNDKK
ncbi:MAG: mechanosensitive ion channel [Clostridia bacterium]|nr:mechanosensitive ion channel [Clostridia bacterium]